MKLTKSGEYAVRCVVYLAQQPEGSLSPLEDISRVQEVPKHLSAKVLQTLARGGIVKSSRGTGGGYTLARPAGEITLLNVIECIEGPICLNYCLKDGECLRQENPLRSESCPIHNVWEEAQNKFREVLGSYKIDELARKTACPLDNRGYGIYNVKKV